MSRPHSRIVDGKVALAGDIASVKAAIDTKGSSALAKSDAVDRRAGRAARGRHRLHVPRHQGAVRGLDRGGRLGRVGTAAGRRDLGRPARLDRRCASASRVTRSGSTRSASTRPRCPDPTRTARTAWRRFAPPSTVALVAGNDLGTTLNEWIALYRGRAQPRRHLHADRPGRRHARRARRAARLDGRYGRRHRPERRQRRGRHRVDPGRCGGRPSSC